MSLSSVFSLFCVCVFVLYIYVGSQWDPKIRTKKKTLETDISQSILFYVPQKKLYSPGKTVLELDVND